MDRYPYAQPNRWWSPRPHRGWVRFWRPIRRFQQRRGHRIRQIDVDGLDHVNRASDAGYGVLITPNHAGHGDCYLLLEALSRLPGPSYIMTAWQVFQMMPRWQQIAYCQHGCFSINREGRDFRAFRQAVETLAATSHPLVIFPEGEVYHLNDLVKPFREGTLMIASAAVRQSGRPVACLPCAIKYFYINDPRPQLLTVIQQIERKLGIRAADNLPLDQRVERLQLETLAWREEQYLGQPLDGDPAQRRDQLIETLLDQLEHRYDLDPRDLPIPERVTQLRQKLISITADDGHQISLDDVFAAVQLYSYEFGYVASNPTVERIAETVDKLEEDVLGLTTARIRGTRRGIIRFGEPLLLEQPADRKTGLAQTDQLRGRVQHLIDQLQPPSRAAHPVSRPHPQPSRQPLPTSE
ncbi:MAG: 1-acyl-sn-glycerol-3-phosphate acyltransferase [Planctomycetota bacterium]|nr:1-acyl-sn-glycerol-3-phosphate acyltransferase [Planctomycetota bacterium]